MSSRVSRLTLVFYLQAFSSFCFLLIRSFFHVSLLTNLGISLCTVPVSYVISVSMSFGTSYWQFSPSPSLSCQFSYPLHSRKLGSMTQYYTPKVIDPIKTARLWHCRTRIWFTFWCDQITDMAVSWHQPNLSYISCHVCEFKTILSADVTWPVLTANQKRLEPWDLIHA